MASSGPVHLDCRQVSGAVALRRLETCLKRVRGGARMLIVRTDEAEVIESILRWAELGRARYTVAHAGYESVIRVFLLPRDFDGHPFLAWRPVLMEVNRMIEAERRSEVDLMATPAPS